LQLLLVYSEYGGNRFRSTKRDIDDIMLTSYVCIPRGIAPKRLPPEDDVKKIERKLTA